jgi:tetratricopeptide (TPR) repeat protein
VVSDRFPLAAGADFERWPMSPDAVYPETLRARLRDLRVHPTEIMADQLRFFVPDLDRTTTSETTRLHALRRLLAACGSVHAAGTWLAEHETWDLLTVRYDILEHVCCAFMPHRAPHMAGTSEEDAALYGEVVDRCYRFLDLLLGRYMRLVGPETTIIVASPHGFFSGDERPRIDTRPLRDAPDSWHRPSGIVVARGPGLRRDELVFGATSLDIAPTILTMLDLPVARHMEGRVLVPLFDERPTIAWVDAHTPPHREAAADAEAATRQALDLLRDLGYPDLPAAEATATSDGIRIVELTSLVQVGFARGEWAKTTARLAELLTLKPDYGFAKYALARCRLALGDVEGCRALVGELLAFDTDSPLAHLVSGLISAHEERWEDALASYRRALEGVPRMALLHYWSGAALLGLHRWTEAEAAFERAIELDGNRADAYDALGTALHHQERYADAAAQYYRSLGLRYESPRVHLHLARSLSASGDHAAAVAALQRALALDPRLRTSPTAIAVMNGSLTTA